MREEGWTEVRKGGGEDRTGGWRYRQLYLQTLDSGATDAVAFAVAVLLGASTGGFWGLSPTFMAFLTFLSLILNALVKYLWKAKLYYSYGNCN